MGSKLFGISLAEAYEVLSDSAGSNVKTILMLLMQQKLKLNYILGDISIL